jgi:hypothetical protein
MVYIPTYNPWGAPPCGSCKFPCRVQRLRRKDLLQFYMAVPCLNFPTNAVCPAWISKGETLRGVLWLNNIYPLVCSYMARGTPYRMEVFMGMGTLSINGGLSLITGGELKPPCQGQRWFSRGAGNHCQHRQHVEQNKSQHCKPRKGRHMTNNTNNRIDTGSKRAPPTEATTLPELTYRPCGLEDYVGFH